MQKISDTRRKINDFYAQTGKYSPDAYECVTACVIDQVRRMDNPRHLSAREVLDGIVKSLPKEFGAVAFLVLEQWKIANASDIGEIVFDLIELGILSASAEDRRSDFNIDYPLYHPLRRKINLSALEMPKID